MIEFKWKFDSLRTENVTNFMSRNHLMNLAHGLVVRDKLTLYCEVNVAEVFQVISKFLI